MKIQEINNFNKLFINKYFRELSVGEAFCEHFEIENSKLMSTKDNQEAVRLISEYIE